MSIAVGWWAKLKLITTDGNPALLKSVREMYSSLKVQTYIVRKPRRVHLQPRMAEAKDIFAATQATMAIGDSG